MPQCYVRCRFVMSQQYNYAKLILLGSPALPGFVCEV